MSCTTAGRYKINIKKIDRASNRMEDILGSPFPFLVVPAAVAAETILISGLLFGMSPIVGTPFTLFAQEYDRFGNKVEEQDFGVLSGQLLRAVTSVRSVTVAGSTSNNGNGSYSVAFMATLAGQYSVSLRYQNLEVGAARSIRSPFQVLIELIEMIDH